MGNGYPRVQPDAMGQFMAILRSMENRIKVLETPTGTQTANAVQELKEQISKQVSSDVGRGSGTITWSTSYQVAASFNFTVPDGFTRAVITASGGAPCFSAASTGDVFYMQTLINGNASPESNGVTSDLVYMSAFHSVSLSGLTSGQTIPVQLRCHLANHPGNSSTANVTGMVVYLK